MKKSEDIIIEALASKPGDKVIIICQTEPACYFLLSDLKRARNHFIKRRYAEVEEIIIEKIQQENGKYGVMLYKKMADSAEAFILKADGKIQTIDLDDA